MKQPSITKHISLTFLVYLTLLQTITSRWIVSWIGVPEAVTKIATILLYLPFVVFICWKAIVDLKTRTVNVSIIAYYAFLVYYGALVIYRYFGGMEVKENLYYTLILLGSISLFSIICNNKTLADARSLCSNVCFFSIFLLIYRILFVLCIKRHIYYSPINEIAIGGSIIILFPAVVKRLWESEGNTRWSALSMLSIFGLMVVVFTLSSRSSLFVMLFELLCVAVLLFKRKRVWVKYVSAIIASVLFVLLLVVFDVGESRYAVYRETGWAISTETTEKSTMDPSNIPTPEQSASDQITRSDSMRNDLLRMSVEQVKANPLFGTGDVLFSYDVAGQTFEAPAHNFILATLNCYGLVGLLLLVILVFSILIRNRAFCIFDTCAQETRLLFLLTLVAYFGMGMVQATVYDMQIMPLMFIELAMFSQAIMWEYSAMEEREKTNVPRVEQK